MSETAHDDSARQATAPAAASTTRPLFSQPWLYWLIVGICLFPIWIFHFLPTQDGPAHLLNALILKDYNAPGTRYHEFFDVHWEALPNWTVHLLLAALMHVFSPLVAEKIVVSMYVVGFAWAFRYFQESFGGRSAGWLPSAALLLVFPRCFWMGFYNYCLSIVLFFCIIGFCVRRKRWVGHDAAILCLLFLATWFTHLLGFLLGVVGAVWLVSAAGPGRLARVAWVTIAALPGSLLTAAYFRGSDFVSENGAGAILQHLKQFWSGGDFVAAIGRQLDALGSHLFEPYGHPVTLLTGVTLVLYVAVLISAYASPSAPPAASSSRRWPIPMLALGITALYVLIPDHLPADHGGHLKGRLAPLPLLLCLGICRPPSHRGLGAIVGVATLLALAFNLGLIALHLATTQADLLEFTAAQQVIGERQVLFVSRGDLGRRTVDHFAHAANYYCLDKGNINLDNHEAETRHFPVRFRPGVVRGRGDLASYPNQHDVDRILLWTQPVAVNDGNSALFRGKRLLVLSGKH